MADHMELMFRNQRMDTLEKRIGWYKEQIEQLKAKLEVERMAQRQERRPWQGLDSFGSVGTAADSRYNVQCTNKGRETDE